MGWKKPRLTRAPLPGRTPTTTVAPTWKKADQIADGDVQDEVEEGMPPLEIARKRAERTEQMYRRIQRYAEWVDIHAQRYAEAKRFLRVARLHELREDALVAARIGAMYPPGPPPMTTTSNDLLMPERRES